MRFAGFLVISFGFMVAIVGARINSGKTQTAGAVLVCAGLLMVIFG